MDKINFLSESDVKAGILEINANLQHFYKVILPEKLSVKDGLITLSHWFAARPYYQ